MENDLTPQRLVLLEYDYLQKAIDKFDAQRLQLKNWCAVVCGAILAIAFQSSSRSIAVLAVGAALFFGLSEGFYLSLQSAVIRRSNLLEAGINDRDEWANDPDLYQFGVSQAFAGVTGMWGAAGELFKRGRLYTSSFYVAMLAGSVIAVLLVA